MGVVAAGAVPLAVPAEMRVTKTARYRQMLAEYQLLAREQLICGTQVHVGVADRDEAVAVGYRVAAYLPTLLALSASSPFASDGSDTGYASMRTLVWQRWPTTGLAAPVQSAEEYDRLVDDLVASGVITDAGMVYFDVRPATCAPTLELRVCDSCPSVDTVVLIAGLFRAMVEREAEAARSGAARDGRVAGARPGRAVARRTVGVGGRPGRHQRPGEPSGRGGGHRAGRTRCAPNWNTSGDWGTVSELTRRALMAGTSSARQRRARRRRGRLTDVVDQLIAETAGQPLTETAVSGDPMLLFGYQPGGAPAHAAAVSGANLDVSYDEAVDANGHPRPHYRDGPRHHCRPRGGAGAGPRGGHRAGPARRQRHLPRFRPEPRAAVPRRCAAADGVRRRVGALVRRPGSAGPGAGRLPPRHLFRASNHRRRHTSVCRLSTEHPAFARRAAWPATRCAHTSAEPTSCATAPASGSSLKTICGCRRAWVTRSSTTDCSASICPELRPPAVIENVERASQMLLDTLRAAAPAQAPADPTVVLLSAGWEDSAWFEHTFLAEEMGVALVQPVRPVGARRKADAAHRFQRPTHRRLLRADGRGHAAVLDRIRRLSAAAGTARARSPTEI